MYKKAWAAFPESHYGLVNSNSRPEIWQMPEMFDYACQAMLPGERTATPYAPYYAFVWYTRAGVNAAPQPDQQSAPGVVRLLDLAEERGLLDRLLERIEIARTNVPSWSAADAMKAMVLCRTGRFEQARAIVAPAIELVRKDDSDAVSTYKTLIFWALGAELQRHSATRDLAFDAFKASLIDPNGFLQFRLLRTTDRLPARELVPLAQKTGRRDEARNVLLECLRTSQFPPGYPEATNRTIRMVALDLIGKSLVELGFGADAVRLFREAQTLSAQMDPSLAPRLSPGLPRCRDRSTKT